jgi:hypothetical protein
MLQAVVAVVAGPLENDWDSGEVHVAHPPGARCEIIQSWQPQSCRFYCQVLPLKHIKNGKVFCDDFMTAMIYYLEDIISLSLPIPGQQAKRKSSSNIPLDPAKAYRSAFLVGSTLARSTFAGAPSRTGHVRGACVARSRRPTRSSRWRWIARWGQPRE